MINDRVQCSRHSTVSWMFLGYTMFFKDNLKVNPCDRFSHHYTVDKSIKKDDKRFNSVLNVPKFDLMTNDLFDYHCKMWVWKFSKLGVLHMVHGGAENDSEIIFFIWPNPDSKNFESGKGEKNYKMSIFLNLKFRFFCLNQRIWSFCLHSITTGKLFGCSKDQ